MKNKTINVNAKSSFINNFECINHHHTWMQLFHIDKIHIVGHSFTEEEND